MKRRIMLRREGSERSDNFSVFDLTVFLALFKIEVVVDAIVEVGLEDDAGVRSTLNRDVP